VFPELDGIARSLWETEVLWNSDRRRPNNYQASPSQGRRSSPSGRRQKAKRRKSKRDRWTEAASRSLQCCLRFQRWCHLDEDAAPNTYW